ncbi:MAG TPA: cytochrome c biogenesis protein CcdA [Candidatus Omnitrophota bacterium]|nr:cytochrome c biogenesis protein CcdA [Candidatus Omnitrophota bacterium]
MFSGEFSLIAVFFLGLSLNLTPCVYPMFSITVALFAAEGASRKKAFFHSLIYALGICLMYSVLGAFAAATGSFFGSWLQNPWVLAGIGVFLLIPALSMFELFHLHIPGLPSHIPGSGFLRYLVSGLFAGIVASPCVGPPIIGLLAVAASQNNPPLAFWLFFVMSLGLALPYVILGTFSGALSKLPRSGAWLVWIKRGLGWVMIAWASFYFSLAISPGSFKWVLPMLMIAAGIDLAWIEKGNHKPFFEIFKKVIGIGLIAGALFFLFKPQSQTEVVWEAYRPETVAEIQAAQQPAVFDFYADWCIPCHELDATTYRDERVVKALEGFRRIKVDLTQEDDEAAQAAVEAFEIEGVPTILFLGSNGEEIKPMRTAGYIGPDEFLLLLKAYESELKK